MLQFSEKAVQSYWSQVVSFCNCSCHYHRNKQQIKKVGKAVMFLRQSNLVKVRHIYFQSPENILEKCAQLETLFHCTIIILHVYKLYMFLMSVFCI